MIRSTFIHIPGIGAKTEQRLWSDGITDWRDLLEAGDAVRMRRGLRERIEESERALVAGDSAYFSSRLPAGQQWRLFPEFRDSAAYFDIETTGLEHARHQITTIALGDGQAVRTYVLGENLDDFPADVSRYKLLVSFNGKCFDVPFCEARFPGLKLGQGHIDLRYVLRPLGYSGGLKICEQLMGLPRAPGLKDVDGFMAVRLWYRHMAGDPRALPALLRYNIEDVVNLRWLVERAYNLAIEKLPIEVPRIDVAERVRVDLPFDPSIIDELRW